MTKVQICIFAWAILGLVGAAILLRFGERGDVVWTRRDDGQD
jgi:hypothetical protein